MKDWVTFRGKWGKCFIVSEGWTPLRSSQRESNRQKQSVCLFVSLVVFIRSFTGLLCIHSLFRHSHCIRSFFISQKGVVSSIIQFSHPSVRIGWVAPMASLPMRHWGTCPLEFGKLLCILQLLPANLCKFRKFPQKQILVVPPSPYFLATPLGSTARTTRSL